MHRILAHGNIDKPITLDSADSSENDDSLDTGQNPRILGGGRAGNNALELESPLSLSHRTANEHDDSDDRNKSPYISKRQKSGSLASSSILRHASTARTIPAFEPAPLIEPQLCLWVADADQDWEVRQVIGKEDITGVQHYLVE